MHGKAFPTSMTIVVVPFTALLEETLQYLMRQGISAIGRKHGISAQYTMVFVSVELAIDQHFLGYATPAREQGLLKMVVFDEAHTIIKDANFRKEMNQPTSLIRCSIFGRASSWKRRCYPRCSSSGGPGLAGAGECSQDEAYRCYRTSTKLYVPIFH